MKPDLNVHISLLKDLQNALKDYKNAMKTAKKEEDIIKSQLQFLKISKNFLMLFKASPSGIQTNSLKKEAEKIMKAYHELNEQRLNKENNNTEIFFQGLEEDKEIYKDLADVNIKIAQIRNEEVLKLHQDMLELKEIFKDLGEITENQGNMLKKISDEVDVAERVTERTVNDIQEARNLQKQANNKVCCILIIVFIVTGIIIGVIAGVVIMKQ